MTNVATIGRSDTTHAIDEGDRIVKCGAGLGRGSRRNSPVHVITNAREVGIEVTCTRCVKAIAAA